MIDLDDYVSEDEKKAIAVEEFRRVAAQTCSADFERILRNAAHEIVEKQVDAVFDGGMADTVKAKAVDVIENLTSYTVFGRPNAWDREASKGWTHLQAAIDGAKPLIEERVVAAVAALTDDEMRELIGDRIADAVIAKLAK